MTQLTWCPLKENNGVAEVSLGTSLATFESDLVMLKFRHSSTLRKASSKLQIPTLPVSDLDVEPIEMLLIKLLIV